MTQVFLTITKTIWDYLLKDTSQERQVWHLHFVLDEVQAAGAMRAGFPGRKSEVFHRASMFFSNTRPTLNPQPSSSTFYVNIKFEV